MRLIVATRNNAKVERIRRLVGDLVEVVPLEHEIVPDIDEREPRPSDGFETMARSKAAYWSNWFGDGDYVVATDGGLVIPALREVWDPLLTRRFAGETADDLERAYALLALAADLVGEQRKILWQEVMVVAKDLRPIGVWFAEGEPGYLATEVDVAAVAAGDGFWIPALWICPRFGGKRLSELDRAEREQYRDHWTILGEGLRAFLRSLGSVPTSP